MVQCLSLLLVQVPVQPLLDPTALGDSAEDVLKGGQHDQCNRY